MNLFLKIYRELFRNKITKKFIDSKKYWDDRYFYGGNSGKGSYAKDAIQKANFLNDAILNFGLNNIIDIGCGDGNNLKIFKSDSYFGIDVSKTVIRKNMLIFKGHRDKKFFFLNNNHSKILNEINSSIKNDESIIVSFDVIFHLIEDDIYKEHINFINNINARYCIITSSDNNIDYNPLVPHVRHRNYSNDLIKIGWALIDSEKIIGDRDKREIKLFKKK